MRILLAFIIPIAIILLLITNREPDENLVTIKIGEKEIFAEIADSPSTRSKGLMYREQLDYNSGMWFVFDEETYPSFWMKNTLIPLDILWINSNLEIVHIEENIQPCGQDTCLSYRPSTKSQYVLELNSGWVERNSVKLGQKVTVSYE